ncbi:hypothetical protein DK27_11175 [Xanthomonas arboricola pv. pruni]|nr:hypothetical protein DK27_11175 [Xanthomonas arboricola pv. pruni]
MIGSSRITAAFSALDLLPQRLLLLQRQRGQGGAVRLRPRFHRAKAALELEIGMAQRRTHVDPGVARQVGADEQHITELVFQPRLVVGDRATRELHAQFLDFFLQLFQHRGRAGPIEADPRRARLQLGGALPFRQAACDAGKCGVVLMARRATFVALDLLPVGAYRLRIVGTLLGKHVRVATHQLVAERGDHVGESERALLGGHLRMEDHLQEKVAQLVAQSRQVVAIDGVGNFVGFFDGVWRDAGEGLLHIPRTAVLTIAQARHQLQQALEVAGRRGLRHGVFLAGVVQWSGVPGRCRRHVPRHLAAGDGQGPHWT